MSTTKFPSALTTGLDGKSNCNVCEKIVCGSFEIPKARQHEWRNEKAKSQFKLKSLEGNQIQGVKLMNGESLEEFIKRNKSK